MASGEDYPATKLDEFEALRARLAELERLDAEHQQAKQALQESEERFHSLFDGVPVGLYRTTAAGEFIEANQALIRMLGYPDRATLLATPVFDLYLSQEEREQWLALLHERGTVMDYETLLRRYDGTVIWIRDNARAIRDEAGNIVYYEGSLKDVSERRLAQALTEDVMRTLEEQNGRLDSLYRVGQIVNSTLDFDAILDHLTEEAVRITGATHVQVLLVNERSGAFERHSLRGFSGEEAKRAATMQLPLDQGINGRAYLTHQVVLVDDVKQEPNYFPLIPTTRTEIAVPIVHNNQVMGNLDIQSPEVGAFHDLDIDYLRALAEQVAIALNNATLFQTAQREIVERKRIEFELNRLMDVLARSNEELQQFAYVASHDLQEPLRMVTSFLQLLRSRYGGKMDKDADEFIDFAVDGATRMKTLINDLLLYSRVGTASKPYLPFSCEELLARATANLHVAIQENQAVITHDPFPEVLCDDTQLSQLFQNLLGNAMKFRTEEPPKIHIGVEQKDEFWEFRFSDNGIGIEPEYAERIFIIFQRLHLSTDYPGTGIGLAVCKKIVERHGGRIWVESALGKGSTFCFTIPVIGSERERQSY